MSAPTRPTGGEHDSLNRSFIQRANSITELELLWGTRPGEIAALTGFSTVRILAEQLRNNGFARTAARLSHPSVGA